MRKKSSCKMYYKQFETSDLQGARIFCNWIVLDYERIMLCLGSKRKAHREYKQRWKDSWRHDMKIKVITVKRSFFTLTLLSSPSPKGINGVKWHDSRCHHKCSRVDNNLLQLQNQLRLQANALKYDLQAHCLCFVHLAYRFIQSHLQLRQDKSAQLGRLIDWLTL